MILKWIRVLADSETHDMLEKVQLADKNKFGYIKKRRKEEIAGDILKHGIKAYIEFNQLNIKL